MEELLYTPFDMAAIISKLQMDCHVAADFVRQVWANEHNFIHWKYRDDERIWAKNVDFWLRYLSDQEELVAEMPSIIQDIKDIGGDFQEEIPVYDDADLDFFFKSARLRILYGGGHDYVRFKRRSLMARYGKAKASLKRLGYYHQRLYFYHLQTYLPGRIECDIKDTGIDDTVVLRVI